MDDIMREWPETIVVVIRHGMLCVGCPIAIYHTVRSPLGDLVVCVNMGRRNERHLVSRQAGNIGRRDGFPGSSGSRYRGDGSSDACDAGGHQGLSSREHLRSPCHLSF